MPWLRANAYVQGLCKICALNQSFLKNLKNRQRLRHSRICSLPFSHAPRVQTLFVSDYVPRLVSGRSEVQPLLQGFKLSGVGIHLNPAQSNTAASTVTDESRLPCLLPVCLFCHGSHMLFCMPSLRMHAPNSDHCV